MIPCRQFVNIVRHSATLEVESTDLKDYITQLKNLLTSGAELQNDTTARDANGQLLSLENDKLIITTEDIVKVIEDTLEETKQLVSKVTEVNQEASNINANTRDLQTKLETLNDIYTRTVEDIEQQKQDAAQALNDVTATNMSQLDNKGATVREKMQQTGDTVVQEVTEALKEEKEKMVAEVRYEMTEEAERIIRDAQYEVEELKTKISEELQTENDKQLTGIKAQLKYTADENYEEMKHELRHALAHHYWTEHDFMPLSPLMPDVDDKLTKFYMAFKMHKVDTKSYTKMVNSYTLMFYNDNKSHKNIYVQGEAGIGKSTFCTKIGLVWSGRNLTDCSNNDCNINKNKSIDFSDETVINKFDFVFSLALRNVEAECEIEKMIQKQIINGLPDHTKYDGIVPKVLDKEHCLIILDGLDEWSHQGNCRKPGQIPHRKSWSNTVVLTSTRPWKLNEVCLKDSEICILIQITGLTDTRTFTENVLNCLNDKYETTLGVKDFLTYIKHKRLEHFLDIPVIAMQLLCIWHSGHDLGDSKCNIFLNMLDMLFGRVEEQNTSSCNSKSYSQNEKAEVGYGAREGISNTVLPPCFKSTMFCEQHKQLLDFLGSLAFHTLHTSKREESLVFSESIVKSNVKSTAALKTALTTGILSQQKSPSLLKKRSHFSFLHKTFQEFLAAYYIATHVEESDNIVQTLFQVYGQTVYILDISELFIFVCGLNTEMSSKLSDSIMKSFSIKLTNRIKELYVSGGGNNLEDMTESLQKMILAGYKESISNGHQDPQLALHHVYYDSAIPDAEIYRERLVDRNIDNIVTLCAGTWRERFTLDLVKLQQILTQSSSTISHVRLRSVKGLTDVYLDLFTNIKLKSLYLAGFNTHFDIKLNTSSLLYCYLQEINKDVEHSILSSLTAAPQLHTLGVTNCKNMPVLCQVLHTLPMLHTLHVFDNTIPTSLCQVLLTLSAPLQRLTVIGRYCEDPYLLCQALSTLSNLKYIALWNTDLSDEDILLPISVQEIVLEHVKLTCRSVRRLVDRLTQIPQQVTCILFECIVKPEEERFTLAKHIQQYDTSFDIHRNDFRCVYHTEVIDLRFTKIST